MRNLITASVLAAALAAVPAAAAQPAQDAGEASAAVQRALADPKVDQSVGQAIRVLTDTILNLHVGELKAVIDGRPVTDADKRLTVRDLARRDDPNFEPKLRAQIESARPLLREKAKALASAMPQLMRSAEEMGKSMERIGANLPDPTYPKR